MHAYMAVCMHVYMHVYMAICMHTWLYACMYIYLYACIYDHIHAYMHRHGSPYKRERVAGQDRTLKYWFGRMLNHDAAFTRQVAKVRQVSFTLVLLFFLLGVGLDCSFLS